MPKGVSCEAPFFARVPPAGPRRAGVSDGQGTLWEKGSLDPPKPFVSPAAKDRGEGAGDFTERRV